MLCRFTLFYGKIELQFTELAFGKQIFLEISIAGLLKHTG